MPIFSAGAAMTARKPESEYLQHARQILSNAQGKALSLQQREKLAVELASSMLKEANRTITRSEKQIQAELSRMMRDPTGKVFTTSMTDQCFRSHKNSRIADQLVYLLEQFGVPRYLGWTKRMALGAFQAIGKAF